MKTLLAWTDAAAGIMIGPIILIGFLIWGLIKSRGSSGAPKEQKEEKISRATELLNEIREKQLRDKMPKRRKVYNSPG